MFLFLWCLLRVILLRLMLWRFPHVPIFSLVLNRLKRISSHVNSRIPRWLLQDIPTLSGECKEWRQKLEPLWSGGGFSPVQLIYTSLYKSVNLRQSSDFCFWRLNIWYFWGYWMTNICKFLTFAYPYMFFSPKYKPTVLLYRDILLESCKRYASISWKTRNKILLKEKRMKKTLYFSSSSWPYTENFL